jgi:hypothetical protein
MPAMFALTQRWPDKKLFAHFESLLRIYHDILQTRRRERGPSAVDLRNAYQILCRLFQDVISARVWSTNKVKQRGFSQREHIASLVHNLKREPAHDLLQSVASLFGMLMHFSPSKRAISKTLINTRRPKQFASTYPNSPAVSRMLAENVAKHLLGASSTVLNCMTAPAAERYAEQTFRFRILDPSMESGQLLLEVARSLIRRVQGFHSHHKVSKHLTRALLTRLCSHCLWGIDRNPRALDAVQLAFFMLGEELGVRDVFPKNLFIENALKSRPPLPVLEFEAVINNPPWGETLSKHERTVLRNRFPSLQHHTDTYVAFGEFALRRLKAGGILALILPSQVLATRNTRVLREMLAQQCEIDQIVVLPRSAFSQASVRAVLIIGRRRPSKISPSCHVTIYPLVKNLDVTGPIQFSSLSRSSFLSAGGNSWWPLVSGWEMPGTGCPCLPLGQVARVVSGVKVYSRGKGCPQQTAAVVRKRHFDVRASAIGAEAAIQGRDVQRFRLKKSARHIRVGKWLAYEGEHAILRKTPRVLVREVCGRDGKLTAAILNNGAIPLHGVLTIVPEGISIEILTAILNSQMAALYVRACSASFSKVDFQKITIGELLQMPIPIALIDSQTRHARGFSDPTSIETSQRHRLIAIARRLSRYDREPTVRTINLLETIIKAAYASLD